MINTLRVIITPFMIPATVLLLSILYMLYVNYELREALVQIEYSNGIILNSERTLSLLKDAETGVRGYVYAEDTSFLLPYHQSKALLPVQLDSLSRLLRQNKKDKYQVEKFRTIIYNRLLLLDSVRYLVAHDAANRYKIINIMAQGRLVMDKTVMCRKLPRENPPSCAH